jgi:cell division GTPase FtsZ
MSCGWRDGAVEVTLLTHITTKRLIRVDFAKCVLHTSEAGPSLVGITEAFELSKLSELMEIYPVLRAVEI